jgi:hypothetical protein
MQGPASGSTFDVGIMALVAFQVRDASGNQADCSFQVTVVLMEPVEKEEDDEEYDYNEDNADYYDAQDEDYYDDEDIDYDYDTECQFEIHTSFEHQVLR